MKFIGKVCTVTIAGREMFRGVLTMEDLRHLHRSYPASNLYISLI